MSKTTICPQCHAQLPRRGRFCLECGCDLYEQGLRRPPIHILPIALLVAAGLALVAYLILHRPAAELDPDKEEIHDRTRTLLRLAAEGKYRDIVSRFYQPDAARYTKTSELLRDMVRDSGEVGLRHFSGASGDDEKEAIKFVKKYGAKHPEYAAGLLAALMFQDGALRTKFGAKFGAERTLAFVAWYLSLVFGPVDSARAEFADRARWEKGPDGADLLVVTLQFPEDRDLPEPVPGVATPVRLAWRRLDDGRWALTLGCLENHFHLEEILALLQRVKP